MRELCDLHALGLDRPDDVLDEAALPRRSGNAGRPARPSGERGLGRAEPDRLSLRHDRPARAVSREGSRTHTAAAGGLVAAPGAPQTRSQSGKHV